MRLISAALFSATALLAANAMANADLAKKSNCLACHKTDTKLVGPAYQEVAKKYAGDKGAEARLVEKVKKGGVGVWGNIPMPPNSAVKDEDIKTLVKWVLAGAK
jgi:cytochrome c